MSVTYILYVSYIIFLSPIHTISHHLRPDQLQDGTSSVIPNIADPSELSVTSNNIWELAATSSSGWILGARMDKSQFGLQTSITSTTSITIRGSSDPETSLIFSFSMYSDLNAYWDTNNPADGQYFSVILDMSNPEYSTSYSPVYTYPNCGSSINRQPLQIGNVYDSMKPRWPWVAIYTPPAGGSVSNWDKVPPPTIDFNQWNITISIEYQLNGNIKVNIGNTNTILNAACFYKDVPVNYHMDMYLTYTTNTGNIDPIVKINEFELQHKIPTIAPTANPTISPSSNPSKIPTVSPTSNPTKMPTKMPTVSPSSNPTKMPTKAPTSNPTKLPTKSPTSNPTKMPTVSQSSDPTKIPTVSQSSDPTKMPTVSQSSDPTKIPTFVPTVNPSKIPTASPSSNPTKMPTKMPTISPSSNPSIVPTNIPSKHPSKAPTDNPTKYPTLISTVSRSYTTTTTTSTNKELLTSTSGTDYVPSIITLSALIYSTSTAAVQTTAEHVQIEEVASQNTDISLVLIIIAVSIIVLIFGIYCLYRASKPKVKDHLSRFEFDNNNNNKNKNNNKGSMDGVASNDNEEYTMPHTKMPELYAVRSRSIMNSISGVGSMESLRDEEQKENNNKIDSQIPELIDRERCYSYSDQQSAFRNTNTDDRDIDIVCFNTPGILVDNQITDVDVDRIDNMEQEIDDSVERGCTFSQTVETMGEQQQNYYNDDMDGHKIDENNNDNECTMKWLEANGLKRYYPIFAKNGYETVNFVREITNESELEDIGIVNGKERKLIMRAIRKLTITTMDISINDNEFDESYDDEIVVEHITMGNINYMMKEPQNVSVPFGKMSTNIEPEGIDDVAIH